MDKTVRMDLKTEPLADSSSLFLERRSDSLDSTSSSSSQRATNNPGSASDSHDSKQEGSSSNPTSFHSIIVSSSADSNKMEGCEQADSSRNDCQVVACSSSLSENQESTKNSRSQDAQLGTSQDVLHTPQVSCSLEGLVESDQGATSQREDHKAADSTHDGSKQDSLCDGNQIKHGSSKDEEPSSQGTSKAISSSVDPEKNSCSSACNGSSPPLTRRRKLRSSLRQRKQDPLSEDETPRMAADSCTPNGAQKNAGEISSTQHGEPISTDLDSKATEQSECSSSTSAEAKQIEESKSVKSPSSTSQDSTDTVRSTSESLKKEGRSCAECGASKGLKYQVLFQAKTRFLCSDICFRAFREKQNLAPSTADKCHLCKADIKDGYIVPVGETACVCSEKCLKEAVQHYLEKLECTHCQKVVPPLRQGSLTWEGMVFCNEECLSKHQQVMGATCTFCKSPVPASSLGKYCVRFGMEIHQFCLGRCLDNFKRGLKVCSFCQMDIGGNKSAFLAPVGDKGQFKDFCSQECLARYEKMHHTKQRKQNCSICDSMVDSSILVTYKNLEYRLCGDLCAASFRFKNKILTSICDTCSNLFKPLPDQSITFMPCPDTAKNFCTKNCMSLFVLNNRKITACNWCKVKKYNFDMVQTLSDSGSQQIFCSLNCLALFRASAPASVSEVITCDLCKKTGPPQYHLTMSDASMRNFCSYPCVMGYQRQFSNPQDTAVMTSPPPAAASTPVISSVVSLANPTKVVREVLVKPNPPKVLKNKAALCKPITQSKSSTCKPTTSHKAVQTDGGSGMSGILPIPVPIFIPMPVHMFNRTVPTPFPFPIPQLVPIFLPIPQRSQQHILDMIKELSEAQDGATETEKRKREQGAQEEPDPKRPRLDVVDLMEHRAEMFQKLKSSFGVETFQRWLMVKTDQMDESCTDDLLSLQPSELACYLHLFVTELRRPGSQEAYPPDVIYYLCLGIQAHLTHHGRPDKIFDDESYRTFNIGLTEALKKSPSVTEPSQLLVQEEMLWGSKELGAHSPQVLLNTLVFFAAKGFGLHSAPDISHITFSSLIKRKLKGKMHLVYLLPLKDKAKKGKEDPQMLVVPENPSVAMRCPVKFYEFYISKCPEQARVPSCPFFLKPVQSCSADSPTWFSCDPLYERDIETMLTRLLLVRDAHAEPQLVVC